MSLKSHTISTKLQKLCLSRSRAVGAKFLKGASISEKIVLDFRRVTSGSFSARLQVLFERFLRGGGFGGELSKPLSTKEDEQELNSMSVAIQVQFRTDRE